MGMGRDGGQVGPRIGVGPERVHPPDVVGDARIGCGQQGERAADAEANDPYAFGIDLGPRGEELEGANDAIDLVNVQTPFEQHA